mmetsp:Transcript_14853/g.20400  ORF Transcript_14853/g.20400 Transcript_14853/m.20400 type:complete len:147 (-) Transcript_14853:89-529(-)
MSLYTVPPNLTLSESLHTIFRHYCSSSKHTGSVSEAPFTSMDGVGFAKMCKEAPELIKYIGRTDIDLIFSKAKPRGVRKLDFDHFLDSLLELSVRIFPEESPTIALANFLAKFILALFDQPPCSDDVQAIESIISELTLQQVDSKQ